jgi:hypothetical protein
MRKLGIFSFRLLVKDMPECYHHEATALCRVQSFIISILKGSLYYSVYQCICVGVFDDEIK